MKRTIRDILFLYSLIIGSYALFAQQNMDQLIDDKLIEALGKHKTLVSIPNLPSVKENMFKNIQWVKTHFEHLDFKVSQLESSTLPVVLAEKTVAENAKTLLFYFHLDGQAINPANWDQEDPFVPELKQITAQGAWESIPWTQLENKVDDEWRIFARSAADDKAPIIMMLSALEILEQQKQQHDFNIKIIFDLEEEYSSHGFLSTLNQYKNRYQADYMIIMDGPAHSSNEPTLTFGCRGIATCAITTYGSKLPQHSGHYGNYVPNPVFSLSRLLTSMKDENGKVLINGYYENIQLSDEVTQALYRVPDNIEKINADLGIVSPEKVGNTYQESLQYPSLNVRQIGTSWKGEKLKTIIPEHASAYIDVRLVTETDGAQQLQKIKDHIVAQGYYVIDRDPTDQERLTYPKIVKFIASSKVNAFRTAIDSEIGQQLKRSLENAFGKAPVTIRTMGGTVPIVPAINTLNIPAIIVPMVNMDNNQHNPNENIRIGNIRQGIKICLSILKTSF